MKALTAVVFGIGILCGGAIGVHADTGTLEAAEASSADGASASDSEATPTEASLQVAGSWRAAETEGEERQRLEAIEKATDHMGRFKRGKARGRLAERTSPPPMVIIEMTDSTVKITSGDRALELGLGAEPIEIEGNSGKARISAEREDEVLIVMVQGDDGGRTTRYQADATDLSMDVTIMAGQLEGPLNYVTTYVRAE